MSGRQTVSFSGSGAAGVAVGGSRGLAGVGYGFGSGANVPAAGGSATDTERSADTGRARGGLDSRRDAGQAESRGTARRLGAREAASHGSRHSGGGRPPFERVTDFIGAHRVLSVIVVAFVVLLLVLYSPAKAYYAALRTNATLSTQLSDINASNSTMQGQVDALMTREGIEDEARRRGYVAEGETPVDMSGVDDTNDPSTDTTVTNAEGATDEQKPWYIAVLDVLFQYDPATQGVS